MPQIEAPQRAVAARVNPLAPNPSVRAREGAALAARARGRVRHHPGSNNRVEAVSSDIRVNMTLCFSPTARRCGNRPAHWKLMGVLSRREILTPAIRGNRALHDLAMVGRLELQTNLTALLAVWRRLILGIGMRDLLRFAQFWLGASGRGQAFCNGGSGSESYFKHTAPRDAGSHCDTRALW